MLNINELADGSVEAVGYVGNAAQYWKVAQSGDVAVSQQLKSNVSGELIADEVSALAINDVGVMVGYGYGSVSDPSDPEFPSLECRPLLWKDSTSDALLLPVPDGCQGVAKSINVDGVVLGYIWNDTLSWVIAWKIDLTFPDPESVNYFPFPFLEQEYADDPALRSCAISDSGYGAASADDTLMSYRFQLYFDGGQFSLVPDPQGLELEPLWFDRSYAYDINDEGTVAGCHTLSLNGWSDWHAFVMDKNGGFVTLESLPARRDRGQDYEYHPYRAYSINNAGVAVGKITGYRVVYHAWRGDFPAIWNNEAARPHLPRVGNCASASMTMAGLADKRLATEPRGVLIPVLAP